MKWPSSNALVRLKVSITSLAFIFFEAAVFQKLSSMFTMYAMVYPRNLISDSTLIQDAFDLLSANGGRASFADIANSVFCLSNAEEELAAKLIADLIARDPRFTIDETHLALNADSPELRPLAEIEFVVLDVEAVTIRSQPAKIIELGAYRLKAGTIIDEFETLINPEVPLLFFFQAEDGIRDGRVTGVQTCALPICAARWTSRSATARCGVSAPATS